MEWVGNLSGAWRDFGTCVFAIAAVSWLGSLSADF